MQRITEEDQASYLLLNDYPIFINDGIPHSNRNLYRVELGRVMDWDTWPVNWNSMGTGHIDWHGTLFRPFVDETVFAYMMEMVDAIA